ncbi:MAG: hypothetical protein ACR2JI_06220 [Mycobacterium sp.]
MTASESAADGSAQVAEAAVADAEARAEAAAARAAELRRTLEDLAKPDPQPRAPLRSLIAPLIATLATAALLSATGYMLWAHRSAEQQRRQVAEYTAIARQGVINLMSVDYGTARETVQRVLDSSTGRFRSNFEETADDFVKAVQEEKIVTRASVNDVAVDSMTADSAVVLVSATSQREGPQAPQSQQQPRVWRVVVTMERDGGQMKMSAVEFV